MLALICSMLMPNAVAVSKETERTLFNLSQFTTPRTDSVYYYMTSQQPCRYKHCDNAVLFTFFCKKTFFTFMPWAGRSVHFVQYRRHGRATNVHCTNYTCP